MARKTNHMFSTVRQGERQPMTKSFTKKKPSVPLTIVGFGQGGGNIVEKLARFRSADGKRSYDTYAVNTNQSDLTTLTEIPEENRIWFGQDDFGKDYTGFGKNAEEGTKRLRRDKSAQKTLDNLINERLGKEEHQNIVFVACEGGGTGTSVLNEAIEKFYEAYRAPIPVKAQQMIANAREQFVTQFGEEKGLALFNQKKSELMEQVKYFMETELNKKRLIIVITIPNRSDGGDILRQVSNYTADVWKMVMDKKYNIGHVVIVDNQHLEDEYNKLNESKENLWEYINNKTADIIHEINVGAGIGDTNMVLDAQDLQSIWFTGQGAMFYSKTSKPVAEVKSNENIIEMFSATLKKPYLHGKINYIEAAQEDGEKKADAKMIHHALVFAVVPDKSKFDGAVFLPEAKEKLQQDLYTSENTRVFTGYIEDKDATDVSVYVAYKIEGLPERLEIGLVKEYQEFQKRRQSVNFSTGTIQTIESKKDDSPFGDLNEWFSDAADTTNKKSSGDDLLSGMFDEVAATSSKQEADPTEEQLKALMDGFSIDMFNNKK